MDSINNLFFNKREYLFVNDGTFPAFNTQIRLKNNGGGVVSNDLIFEDKVYAINSNNDTLTATTNYISNSSALNTNCISASNIYNLQPIKSIYWEIPFIDVNDTIYIVYETFRCCPTDQRYYYETKNFDTWYFEAAPGNFYSNECNIVDETFNNSNYGNSDPMSNLFNYQYSKVSELNLKLLNITPTSDLSGKTSICNPSGKQNFELLTSEFVGNEQLFVNNSGQSPNASFRIDVLLEKGLTIPISDYSNINFFNPSLGLNSNIDSVLEIIPNGLDSSLISIYFNIDTFIDYNEFKQFMLSSVMQLLITPCCPTLNDGPVKFYVNWNVNLKPSSCLDCWIPLASSEKEIHVHCPGCVTPGAIVNKVNIERTNFGWEDANNNGLIDNNNKRIHLADSLILESNKFIAMPSDSLHLEIGSFFQDGDNNGGFTYNTWLNYWGNNHQDTLDRLYLDIKAPCSNTNGFNWSIYTDSIKIKDATTNIWSNWIPINSFLERTNTTFFYNIHIDSLRNKGGISSNYFYDIDDEFDFKMDLKICGNDATANDIEECSVDCAVWLSGSDMLSNAFQTVVIAPDTVANHPATSVSNLVQNIGSEFIYNCEAFSSTINLTRLYFSVNNQWRNVAHQKGFFNSNLNANSFSSCRKQMISTFEVRTGAPITKQGNDSEFNYYRYEFRPLNSELISINIDIPNSYNYLGSSVNSYIPVHIYNNTFMSQRIIHDVNNNITAIENNPGILSVNIENPSYDYARESYGLNVTSNAQNITGGSNSLDTLLLGDEKWKQQLRVFFYPDSTCNIANENINGNQVKRSNRQKVGCFCFKKFKWTKSRLFFLVNFYIILLIIMFDILTQAEEGSAGEQPF